MKSWGEFERFALDGPDREWLAMLFWPQFLAEIVFLIIAPIRERLLCKNATLMPIPKPEQGADGRGTPGGESGDAVQS